MEKLTSPATSDCYLRNYLQSTLSLWRHMLWVMLCMLCHWWRPQLVLELPPCCWFSFDNNTKWNDDGRSVATEEALRRLTTTSKSLMPWESNQTCWPLVIMVLLQSRRTWMYTVDYLPQSGFDHKTIKQHTCPWLATYWHQPLSRHLNVQRHPELQLP